MRFRSPRGLVPALLVAGLCLMAHGSALAQPTCPCILPDNGGTADLMPSCPTGYVGIMELSTGLPAGSTIAINASLENVVPVSEVPGGSLGGHIQTFTADLHMQMTGTGTLLGFNRIINLPVSGVAHSAPRTLDDPIQSFAHEIVSLTGQLFGDPDFCTLEFTAGTDEGLPASPGVTTLTRLGGVGTDWAVDSFFDITYDLEFQGCPGSILDGHAGVTRRTDTLILCETPTPVETVSWGSLKSRFP